MYYLFLFFFFFFQAEDGIRDGTVTGVQTCALPIYLDREIELEVVVEIVAAIANRGARLLGQVVAQHELGTIGAAVRRRDRKCVVWGKSVDLGGRRISKKKKKKVGGM